MVHVFAEYKEAICDGYSYVVQQVLHKTSMRLTLISTLGLCAAVFGQGQPGSRGVDDYIRTQGRVSKEGLLANIGPSGAKASGAKVRTFKQAASTITKRAHHPGWRCHC